MSSPTTQVEQERGYANGRARRIEILDRAEVVFAEVGYHSASLREIAARCGISHPGLKHHFPTKEALLIAVLERRDETALATTQAAVGSAADELRRIVDLVAGNATKPRIVELFATLSAEATAADHPAHAFFADRYRRIVSQLAEAYRSARDAGELRHDLDPGFAARELVALMDGLQVQWLYDPETVDMAAIVGTHLQGQLTSARLT